MILLGSEKARELNSKDFKKIISDSLKKAKQKQRDEEYIKREQLKDKWKDL